MRINEIIREKRKELSLTQEQMAEYLGVSTPAVNKWEKGSTCPDITLLPAIARLLRTDLNTLFCFESDLTDIEIEKFVKEVDRIVREQDYETAFQTSMEKMREYPACEKLVYAVIPYLDGALMLYNVAEQERYKETFEKYYERLCTSDNDQIRELGICMVISYKLVRRAFAEAEELINSIGSTALDREEYLAVLYTRQKKYREAEKIWGHRVLKAVTEIQTALMNMIEIASDEGRDQDADLYADRYESVSRQFSVAEWISYTARMELSVKRQDKDTCMKLLRLMLPAMKGEWTPGESPLYRGIDRKVSTAFVDQVSKTLERELLTGEEFAFIREDPAFDKLIEELNVSTDT